jgi:uncharacterized protein YutE (UPF0331/DUF86 family)
MNAGKIRTAIVTERVAWVRKMVDGIRNLPLTDFEAFKADERTPAAAESYLRRALEALLDLGRHILAKGFAIAPTEYKEVADQLGKTGVLSEQDMALLKIMAGYRNRMVHFYHEVSESELYEICTQQMKDLETVLDAVTRWLKEHPEMMNESI